MTNTPIEITTLLSNLQESLSNAVSAIHSRSVAGPNAMGIVSEEDATYLSTLVQVFETPALDDAAKRDFMDMYASSLQYVENYLKNYDIPTKEQAVALVALRQVYLKVV
jgi:hypothetical protein